MIGRNWRSHRNTGCEPGHWSGRLAVQDHGVEAVARPAILRNRARSPGELEISLDATEIDGRISERSARSATIVDPVVVERDVIGANQSNAVGSGIVHEVVAHDRRLVPQAIGDDAVLAGPVDLVSRQGQAFARRRRRWTSGRAEEAGNDATRLDIRPPGRGVANGARVHVDGRIKRVDPILTCIKDRGSGNRQPGQTACDGSAVDGDAGLHVIDQTVHERAVALTAGLVGDGNPSPVCGLGMAALGAGHENRRAGNGGRRRARCVFQAGEDRLAARATRDQAAAAQGYRATEGLDDVSGPD